MTTSNGTGLASKTLAPAWLSALITGTDPLPQLPRPRVDSIAEARLEGFALGWDARRLQVAALEAKVIALNYEADRLYMEMCRRVPVKQTDYLPFATLKARRADYGTRDEK